MCIYYALQNQSFIDKFPQLLILTVPCNNSLVTNTSHIQIEDYIDTKFLVTMESWLCQAQKIIMFICGGLNTELHPPGKIEMITMKDFRVSMGIQLE